MAEEALQHVAGDAGAGAMQALELTCVLLATTSAPPDDDCLLRLLTALAPNDLHAALPPQVNRQHSSSSSRKMQSFCTSRSLRVQDLSSEALGLLLSLLAATARTRQQPGGGGGVVVSEEALRVSAALLGTAGSAACATPQRSSGGGLSFSDASPSGPRDLRDLSAAAAQRCVVGVVWHGLRYAGGGLGRERGSCSSFLLPLLPAAVTAALHLAADSDAGGGGVDGSGRGVVLLRALPKLLFDPHAARLVVKEAVGVAVGAGDCRIRQHACVLLRDILLSLPYQQAQSRGGNEERGRGEEGGVSEVRERREVGCEATGALLILLSDVMGAVRCVAVMCIACVVLSQGVHTSFQMPAHCEPETYSLTTCAHDTENAARRVLLIAYLLAHPTTLPLVLRGAILRAAPALDASPDCLLRHGMWHVRQLDAEIRQAARRLYVPQLQTMPSAGGGMGEHEGHAEAQGTSPLPPATADELSYIS